jgi:hypothetical protein
MDATKDRNPSPRRSSRPGKLVRIGYSLLSALIVLIVLSLGIGISNFRNGASEILTAALATFIYGGYLCLAGWILALPLVISIRRYRGWRYWTMMAGGTCIGPLVILLGALYLAHYAYHLVYLAAGVSFLTSLLYLSFVRPRSKPVAEPPKSF